jgi:hypothetical protein
MISLSKKPYLDNFDDKSKLFLSIVVIMLETLCFIHEFMNMNQNLCYLSIVGGFNITCQYHNACHVLLVVTNLSFRSLVNLLPSILMLILSKMTLNVVINKKKNE